MDPKAAHYVAQARGCHGVAHACRDPNEKALWLRIAGDWARIAESEIEATQLSLKSVSK